MKWTEEERALLTETSQCLARIEKSLDSISNKLQSLEQGMYTVKGILWPEGKRAK